MKAKENFIKNIIEYVVLWKNDATVYKGEDAPSLEKG